MRLRGLFLFLGALFGLPGLAAPAMADLDSDLEILANIRSEARIDDQTEAWWQEDFLAPKRPVTDTARRLDDGAARLGDPYVILYADLLRPAAARAVGPLLTLIQARPDVRVFLKHTPQDGSSQTVARCFERLRAEAPGAARQVLGYLHNAVGLTGAVDTGELITAMTRQIAASQPAAEDRCAGRNAAAHVDADLQEALDFGLADAAAFIVNGYRVTAPQELTALEALIAWARVRARGEPVERGPPPPKADTSGDPHAACLENARGDPALEIECGLEHIQRRDARLNTVWRSVYPELRQQAPEAADALLAAQRKWVDWKMVACAHYRAGHAFGRDGLRAFYPLCMTTLIDQRIDELELIGTLLMRR
jgi:uncharacterized protein YecT (DUF1311 family)/protein-disulfide isomerase